MADRGARGLRLDGGRAHGLPLLGQRRASVLPGCGTQLAFRDMAEPAALDVTLASLDEPAAVRPSHHIWTSSRIAWFEIADDLPRYPERGPAPS